MFDVFKVQLEPHYQPIISLKRGSVFGYESLIRGNHKVLHTPEKLFHQAAKQEKKQELDLLCFKKGIESAPAGAYIFLNINACTLVSTYGQDFFNKIDLNRVVVEITEYERIKDRKKFEAVMKWLKSKGCGFALDDISSGYDRLLNLVEYEADYVKIDRALIKNCDQERKKEELLKHLIDISKIYDAKTIAEGVETEEEYQKVKELGFDYGQGFYFAKPLPVHEIQKTLMNSI